MQILLDLLSSQSLFLLFFVAAAGHLLGKISIRGVNLGVSAVLFVGLALSALDGRLALPAILTTLGLVLFVYSIGIASGPGFFASLKHNGARNNLFIGAMLLLAAGCIMVVGALLHLQAPVVAGLFTGALTNTPALAGVVQLLSGASDASTQQLASLPAVGYAVAYPMGVLGPILAIAFWQRRFKINYETDARRADDTVGAGRQLYNQTVEVGETPWLGSSLKSAAHKQQWPVVFGRIQHDGQEWLAASADYIITKGDLISIIGAPEDVTPVIRALGIPSQQQLSLDLSQHRRHRIVVSNSEVAGRKLRGLQLPERFGAMITRVRRGDVDMLAHKDLILEYGDQALVLTGPHSVSEVRAYLGDSHRETSSINIPAIGIGICLGLLVGSIPIALPGGIVFRLGDAGGPLLVGLCLSALHRSGRLVWGLPYTANLTLRELGLIMMLAGIGTRSGQTFITALQDPRGPLFLAGAAAVSLLIPFIFLPVAYKKFKLPFAMATGMMAATHTQPAVQAYAVQQAGNDLPNHGYALAFPTATILKIVIAQLLVISLV